MGWADFVLYAHYPHHTGCSQRGQIVGHAIWRLSPCMPSLIGIQHQCKVWLGAHDGNCGASRLVWTTFVEHRLLWHWSQGNWTQGPTLWPLIYSNAHTLPSTGQLCQWAWKRAGVTDNMEGCCLLKLWLIFQLSYSCYTGCKDLVGKVPPMQYKTNS